ncbi:MAG: DUF1152 domain-containing protein [Candidatus Eremiobacteraeota bacterium]|nr:DUF1152 domain-containing protein [Candidatus Eremiobacteraeota bacterium]
MELGSLPLLERLSPCRSVLIAGAGGGFDVLAGVPLFEHLRSRGKRAYLASLSFSDLESARGRLVSPAVLEVRHDAGGNSSYFPERYLSEWYREKGQEVPVYCFKPSGAAVIRQAYEDLIGDLDIDALVLVDGGTDILMRGDEPELGTPFEDMASLAAAHTVALPVRLMVNLGFGVDFFHGVCHAYVLQAVADLTAQGAFLGAFSLLPSMPEFQAFTEAVDFISARMPGRESIVATSVAAAGKGCFGDHHSTDRTRGSRLFINPLMSMYWSFEVDGVARRCLYMDYLLETRDRWDMRRAIENYLSTVTPREWMNMPL